VDGHRAFLNHSYASSSVRAYTSETDSVFACGESRKC
jgi:hypothetical protein